LSHVPDRSTLPDLQPLLRHQSRPLRTLRLPLRNLPTQRLYQLHHLVRVPCIVRPERHFLHVYRPSELLRRYVVRPVPRCRHVEDDPDVRVPAILLTRHALHRRYVERHQQTVDRQQHCLVLLVHLRRTHMHHMSDSADTRLAFPTASAPPQPCQNPHSNRFHLRESSAHEQECHPRSGMLSSLPTSCLDPARLRTPTRRTPASWPSPHSSASPILPGASAVPVTNIHHSVAPSENIRYGYRQQSLPKLHSKRKKARTKYISYSAFRRISSHALDHEWTRYTLFSSTQALLGKFESPYNYLSREDNWTHRLTFTQPQDRRQVTSIPQNVQISDGTEHSINTKGRTMQLLPHLYYKSYKNEVINRTTTSQMHVRFLTLFAAKMQPKYSSLIPPSLQIYQLH
jgi:hypothetical protein